MDNPRIIGPGDITREFRIEVAKGTVPGHGLTAVLLRIAATTGGTFADWWGGGGDMSPILGAEQYELSSTDDDTFNGLGAWSVRVISLDADYKPQSFVVNLDGQSSVTLDGTLIAPRLAQVEQAGSTMPRTNLGDIEIRKLGSAQGVDIRNFIPAGLGLSRDGHFTVPDGRAAIVLHTALFPPTNRNAISRNLLTAVGANTPVIVGLDTPFYDGAFLVPNEAPFLLPSRLNLNLQVSTNNPGTSLQGFLSIMLIDNDKLGPYGG